MSQVWAGANLWTFDKENEVRTNYMRFNPHNIYDIILNIKAKFGGLVIVVKFHQLTSSRKTCANLLGHLM